MLKIIKDTINEYDMLQSGQKILVGISGGADSVALLKSLLSLKDDLEIEVCACHINHMIRGDESDRDEMFVRDLCSESNVKLEVHSCNVPEYAEKQGLGIEQAARELRYDALNKSAQIFGAQKIALAHNLDDNLETMIFHLARGTGALGLGGIPAKRDNIIRPLINCERSVIEKYLLQNNANYVHDSTNDSTDYTRNLIRQKIVPILREINPKCAQATGRTSKFIKNDDDYLSKCAKDKFDEIATVVQNGFNLSCDEMRKIPDVLQTRIFRLCAEKVGMSMTKCTSTRIKDLQKLLNSEKSSGKCILTDDLIAIKEYGNFFIGKKNEKIDNQIININKTDNCILWQKDTKISFYRKEKNEYFNNSFNTFAVDCDKIDFSTLCIRQRKTGDALKSNENSGHKTLKKLMIDKKIPISKRDKLAVIADKNGVIAVQDIGIAYERQAQGENSFIFKIEGKN